MWAERQRCNHKQNFGPAGSSLPLARLDRGGDLASEDAGIAPHPSHLRATAGETGNPQEELDGRGRRGRAGLTVAFDVALGILPLVQFGFAVLLLQLWPEALVRRGALLLRGVVGRGDAGAVGRARRQRFAVAQDVLD